MAAYNYLRSCSAEHVGISSCNMRDAGYEHFLQTAEKLHSE